MESSVDSFINAQPETVLSKGDYYQQFMKAEHPGWSSSDIGQYNDINYKIAKFFGDPSRNKFESEYEAYLNNVNNRNERLATQSARAYDKWMDDTKYQRMFKDFEKAGLNPYLLVNNGSFSATAPTSSKASYEAKQGSQKQTDSGRNFALILLAIARVAAALM